MYRRLLSTVIACSILLIFFFAVYHWIPKRNAPVAVQQSSSENPDSTAVPAPAAPATENNAVTNPAPATSAVTGPFIPPLDRAKERVTKKPFGIYITPATSPVQPERFQGYHTGTDFEIFPDELDAAVPVKAICAGKIAEKKWASGYGGVLVQDCQLDGAPITVIYGHLNVASIAKNTGDDLAQGETIGDLGADKSQQTDGERKHLHLGIHKGASINILGYVSSQSQLSGWIDACQYVCNN